MTTEEERRLEARMDLLDKADRELTEQKFSAIREQFVALAKALELQQSNSNERLTRLTALSALVVSVIAAILAATH